MIETYDLENTTAVQEKFPLLNGEEKLKELVVIDKDGGMKSYYGEQYVGQVSAKVQELNLDGYLVVVSFGERVKVFDSQANCLDIPSFGEQKRNIQNIELRKELRILIESKSKIFSDGHGRETKALITTDVMRVLLEDKKVQEIQNKIIEIENYYSVPTEEVAMNFLFDRLLEPHIKSGYER